MYYKTVFTIHHQLGRVGHNSDRYIILCLPFSWIYGSFIPTGEWQFTVNHIVLSTTTTQICWQHVQLSSALELRACLCSSSKLGIPQTLKSASICAYAFPCTHKKQEGWQLSYQCSLISQACMGMKPSDACNVGRASLIPRGWEWRPRLNFIEELVINWFTCG